MDFFHNGKRIRKRIPTTRRDIAIEYEADQRIRYLRGNMGLEFPDVDLATLIARYLDFSHTNNSPGTFTRDKFSLQVFRKLSQVKMSSEITPLLMEDYKSKRAESVSPRTVNVEVKTVKAMLNKAVEWGLIRSNPFASVRLLKQTRSKLPRFLSKEEITALLNAATGTYRPIMLTFLKTGLRLNELVNLEWQDIDFNNGQIRVVNKEDKRYHPKEQIGTRACDYYYQMPHISTQNFQNFFHRIGTPSCGPFVWRRLFSGFSSACGSASNGNCERSVASTTLHDARKPARIWD